MTVFQAIQEMRRLSADGKSFAFSFMSYDRNRQISKGIISVNNARLRNRGNVKYNEMAEYQQEYLDLDTNEPKRFWQPLLMTFNHKPVTL